MTRSTAVLAFGTALLLAGCTDPSAVPGDALDEPPAVEVQHDEEDQAAEDYTAEAADGEDSRGAADQDGSAAPSEDGDGADSPDADQAARGTVVIDGATYEITEMRRCEPLQEGAVQRELELQGLGESGGDRIQIDVYVQTIAGVPMDDVSWSGPEGIFGEPRGTDVTVDDAARAVHGTATLHGAMDPDVTVEVVFDLEVPAQTVACR